MLPDRSRVVLAALLLVAASLLLGSKWLDARESVVRLTVHCDDGRCVATVDGGPELVVDLRPGTSADRAGLYLFHPYEWRATQAFRNLSVRKPRGVESLDLSLLRGAELDALDADRAWTVEPGHGLVHDGEPGERAIALLQRPVGRDFTLELELVSSLDAGVILGATDEHNGTLIVVRNKYNDALACQLDDGRPGPILAFAQLETLRAPREAWRLSGLVAEIVLLAAALLAAVRVLLAAAGNLSRPMAPIARLVERAARSSMTPWLLFAASFAAMAAVAVWGLGRMPHIEDEAAYLFQARIFAGGALWAPTPPLPDFFSYDHVLTVGGRWFAKYPPLYPLLLSFGVRLGVPWLVNPLIGACTGLAAFLLAREVAGRRAGVLAWLLLLASPFFAIMGATMMSHMTAALLVTLAMWLILRGLRDRALAPTLAAGACLGLAVFARPYTAFLACAVVGAFGLFLWLRSSDRGRLLALGLSLAVVVLPFLGAFTMWNGIVSGEGPSLSLYAVNDSSDRLGFGPDRGYDWLVTWGSYGHTPAKALRSVHQYLEYTSNHLFGWPARVSFTFVLAALWWGRRRPECWLLAGLFAALVLGHGLYWATQHLLYGARYWFAATPALVVLSALGIRALARTARPASVPALTLLLGGLIAWNFLFYFPDRYRELSQFGAITPDLQRAVAASDLHDAVVFLPPGALKYTHGFYMNDPFLRSDRVFARDLGTRNESLLEHFPGFTPYRWDGHYLAPLAGRRELRGRHRGSLAAGSASAGALP